MTNKKIKINELFSGIGAQRKALLNLGFEVDVIGISEIDKYAIQSYEAIFGETYNYGDICTTPKLDYADLWTYSFPCQDISVAGNQKGINENTRSGLLYQVQRLLEVAKEEGTLPKYLLLENVKNLVGKKFKHQFLEWIEYLDKLGYNTYWQVLNAKNYGIPQNRERVFAISIRKDLNQSFKFPKTEELTIRLKDLLEDNVDKKFYLSQEKVNRFLATGNVNPSGHGMNGNVCTSDICNTLTTNKGEGLKILVKEATKKGYAEAAVGNSINIEQPNSKTRRGRVGHGVAQTLTTAPQQVVVEKVIGASRGRNPGNPSDRTVGAPTQQRLEINTQGTSNTITTVQKDNYVVEIYQQPRGKNNGGFKEVAPTITSSKYEHNNLLVEAKIQQVEGNLYPNSGNPQAGRVYKVDGISPALDTCQGGNRMPKIIEGIRIRKLTPLECWRLMGFEDKDFYKAQTSGVSNSQLYKQAGNSIVVNILEKIFKNFL